jgi:nucleoside phosphorylase
MTNSTLTVLCPMKMESAKFNRIARRHGWTLITTGIGAEAVQSALSNRSQAGPVLLAGVAGALRPELKPGTAHLISEVYTTEGILQSPLNRNGLRATGADEIVGTPQDKARLAERTGAHVVDMESHAFAVAAEAAGRPWAIIRGVSDGVDHHLPAGCDAWFTPQGGIRPFVAAKDLACRPKDLLLMLAFARRTSRAMRNVAQLAEETFLDHPGYAAT